MPIINAEGFGKLISGQTATSCSIGGVAQAYADFLDVLICDQSDAVAAEALRKNGLRVHCTQTIMRSVKDRAALGREVLALVGGSEMAEVPQISPLLRDPGGGDSTPIDTGAGRMGERP